MASGRIRLITFDLDNTLWPVQEVIQKADGAMRTWLDERLPGFSAQFSGDAFMLLRKRIVAERPDLQHDLSSMRIEVLCRAITAFGQPTRAARSLAERAFEVFIDHRHKVRYFDGVEEVLAELATRYTLGALTNGNADFSRLEINRHISFGFSSASVGASKPHPDMFHAALRHADVRPEQAVHVGDHPHDDIHGAAAVGMRTILVQLVNLPAPAIEVATQAPDVQISTLSELRSAIASLDP